VQSFLDSVETPLGTVYERTLRRFQMRPAADNQVIKSAFEALAACLRPPTSAEFLYMIQNDCLSCDARLLKARLSYENIPNLFQGLLEINPETKAFQFSHYSIHEFLTSSQLQDTSLREYSVNEKHAHERLARLCVKALMSHDLEPSTPFYDYAAALWMEHARKAGSSTELDSEIARFLSEGQFSDWRDDSSFAIWMTYSEEKKTVPFRNKYDPSKAFLQALILGRESVTSQLIDNGLHHIRDPHGCTVPIVDAVIRGASKEIIGKLIEFGSDVEDVRFGDQTALTWAVQKEDKELISFLLDKGADVNKIIDKDQVGGSAFNQALLFRSPDIVSFLIMKGADVRQPVSHVGTAIQVAVCERRMDILKVILQNSGDVRESKGRYGTVLHLAVEKQDIDNEQVVRLLFDHGAEEVINATLPDGGSALHHAIAYNSSPRLVNLLLDKGADPNLESAPSTNPLHRAILNNDVITVDNLIRKGATGYSEYGPFKSALECAAFAGHEGLFRRILEFTAIKGQTSTEFSRVLQRSIISGHFNILTRLVQEGGKTQVGDEHGWNPFVCALHVKSDRTLTLLEQGQDSADTVNAGITALPPTKWVLEKLPDCHRSLVQSEHSKLQFSGTLCSSSSLATC
jgi:ankyrin repeat protein